MTENKMQLVDWLDDLCVRFIINLPQEELESVARICFQVEEAQWFYEDFIRPTDPSLPSLNLRDFCLRIFQHCPLLSTFSDSQHTAAYQEFLAYKTRVPVRGAILLNHEMDQVVLVKGWKKSATWSFPRGKINKDEPDLDCAIREVWEETGYDIAAAGLVTHDQKYIDVTMREQHLRMFVFRSVPLDTVFEPQTRKEISKIEWYRLVDLPTYTQKRQNRHQQDGTPEQGSVSANKLYMVAPFLPPLKKWINLQKKRDAARLLQAGSLPEELEYVPSDTPNLETHVLSEPPAGAADELKRLLSVNVVAANSDQTAGNDGNQANALLAMLRGNSSLAPPVEAPLPPRTPLDQVFTTPPEPGTPHHQHPQPSPAVRQQAPPAFPFSSPAQQVNHQHTNSLHPPGFFGQDAQRTQQRLVPQMSHMSQQSAHESRHIYPTGSHPSMQQQLFPGGHPAQISHGPIAPSASQLPAPRLNNHAMNLLNAFKAPAYAREASPVNHHVMPHANMNYPQSQHQVPTGEPPQGRRRSAHQNSLLDLFKSPEAQKAAPVAQTPPDNVPTPRNNQPIVPVTSSTAGIPINQKGVNTAMMTRTLPRHKSATGGDMFPAKHAVQKAQAAQNRSTSEASSMGTRRGPVSILPRPGSSTTTMTTTREPDGAPSPHKPRRGHKSESPSNFTILQRPSPRADRNGSPGIAEGKKMLAQKQQAQRHDVSRRAQEAPKQFQPQILQRPRADKAATSPSLEQQLHNDGDARNTLLALFAKQKPGMGNIEARSASAMSGGSGAPLAADSSIFRSRLASASSVVSNGGDNDGLRSPATPVEAKGFLLDYLNGVVKNEKNKGGVRRGPG